MIIRKINATQLNLKKQKSEDFLFLDLRTSMEWRKGNIGGNHVNAKEVSFFVPKMGIKKDKMIILSCINRQSKRIEFAAKELRRLGYKNVVAFTGMFNWMMQFGRKNQIEKYKN